MIIKYLDFKESNNSHDHLESFTLSTITIIRSTFHSSFFKHDNVHYNHLLEDFYFKKLHGRVQAIKTAHRGRRGVTNVFKLKTSSIFEYFS